MDIYPASVVKSTAGRDKGKLFVVTEKIDDLFVYISDGDLRPIIKPKKKKIKHLKSLGFHIDFIKEKLENGNKITNSDIRKSLAEAIYKSN